MKNAPNPSKLGPCQDFQISSGSKFCNTCGHTNGTHRFTVRKVEGYVVVKKDEQDTFLTLILDSEMDARARTRSMNKDALVRDLLR